MKLGEDIGGESQVAADNLRNLVNQITNINIILAWTEETNNLLSKNVNISYLTELRESISQLETVQMDLVTHRTGLDLLKDKVC